MEANEEVTTIAASVRRIPSATAPVLTPLFLSLCSLEAGYPEAKTRMSDNTNQASLTC